MLELIKSLSQAYGPAGREDRVRELIKDCLPSKENIIEDALGNLIFIKKGSGKKIMVAAHMDEVGIIVTDIDEHGFLRLAPVGGVSAYSALGKRFVFPGGVTGVVAVEKVENLHKLTYKELYLDIGAAAKKEAVAKISIGEIGVYEGSFAAVNNRLLSKALDDRVGCAILLEALRDMETDNEIYFVFSVQEELGLRGAATAAYRLNPDYGL
ncbi:MAG TPA: M42 family metallopeptidase, partial [Firmicutes bacterium]|nr:M42 family metallopeptidase [Bacillota bacterium]